MNYGRAYSPPREGGVSAPSKNGSVPKTARTGWSLTSYVSKCVLKHWLVSDHPVCGASVAARLFIDAAATPPLQGGECAPLNSSTFVHTLFSRRLRLHTRKIRSIIRVAGAFVFRHLGIWAQRPRLVDLSVRQMRGDDLCRLLSLFNPLLERLHFIERVCAGPALAVIHSCNH